MKGEINRDWYCSAGCSLNDKRCRIFSIDCDDGHCQQRHRKHPTPEQFKEEYGEEYPDDGAVWHAWKHHVGNGVWVISTLETVKQMRKIRDVNIICACTPFGKPDDNWRPE